MTDAQILETLSQLVRDKLKVDAPLDGELADHLDSIQRLTLVVAIEDHFEICFDESDEAEITGLDDLVRAIRSKLSGTNGRHAQSGARSGRRASTGPTRD